LKLLLIVATTFVIYWPAMHGGPVWDDEFNLTKPELRSLHGLFRIWFDPIATAGEMQYYPLVHSAFWIEHQLWGDAYLGYHLVNVLWHSLATVLLYLVLEKLSIPGALVAAAVFAVHPVMVESVAWMTEQKNTLSTVFYLAATLAYLNFDQVRGCPGRGCLGQRPSAIRETGALPHAPLSRYLLALGLFACALFSKTATVTFPAVLLVIFWWQRGTLSWRRDVVPLAPFFGLALLAGLMTIYVETRLVGAEGAEFELTFVERFLLAGRNVWFYVTKLLWPANLSFTYRRWTIDPTQWWQWTFTIAALATTVALWAIRKRSRGPLAAWLIFCGTLAPVLGFVNVYMFRYTFVADHLQYLASIALIVLASAGIALAFARLSLTGRRALATVCVLVLATFAALSWQRSHIYANITALYEDTIQQNPSAWMAHNNLGLIRQSEGDYPTAIAHYHSSLRINPTNARAQNNLGRALTETGRLPEAIEVLRAARDLQPENPFILNNLAAAHIHSGQYGEARQLLESALSLEPDYAEAHDNLGLLLGLTGQLPEAIEQFREASRLNPNSANPRNNLGLFLSRAGHHEEAKRHYQQALQLAPNRADIRTNFAEVIRLTGHPLDAIQHYEIAIRLNPNHMQAYAGLSHALAQVGRTQESISMAGQALALARANGQTAEVQYLENWLKQIRKETRP
jgi:Flp pilus assembly protein TadD